MPLTDDPAAETFEELRTKEYRLVASLLSSAEIPKARASLKQLATFEALDVLPSTRVAQHLLSHHPGWIPKRLLVSEDPCVDTDESSQPTTSQRNNESDICIPCCPHCGGLLQPGLSGTTIRLISKRVRTTSRTQRRRLSRRVAAEKKKLEYKKAPSSGTTKPQSELAKFVATNFDTTTQQHDKQCRNVIRIQCPCGGTTVLPGFQQRSTKQQNPDKKQKQQGVQSKEPARTIDPTKDFISMSTKRGGGGGKKKRERKETVSSTGPKIE